MFVEYYKNKRDKSSELVENCKKYLDQKKNKI